MLESEFNDLKDICSQLETLKKRLEQKTQYWKASKIREALLPLEELKGNFDA